MARTRVLAVLTVLALHLAALPAAAMRTAGSAPNDTPTIACTPRADAVPDGDLTVVSSRAFPGTGGRTTEYVLRSPALGRDTRVNVLLPSDYDPATRYPVLYLLHGASGAYDRYEVNAPLTQMVDEETAAQGLSPFIVVTPDGGKFGFYSDWFGVDVDGHNPGPAPGWATHHTDELVRWVDATFSTIGARGGRGVAGISMGGFGAMSYATRHPDMFGFAASLSGAVNPNYGYPYGNAFLTSASPAFNASGMDQCIWGEYATQQVRWLGADPTYLADNLAGTGTDLWVYSGGGDQNRPSGLLTDPIEQSVYLMSRAFVDRLQALDVPATVDFPGRGTHTWGSWQPALRTMFGQMNTSFARGTDRVPTAFDHRSAMPAFDAWGWSFSVDRLVTEFTYLTDVSADGLTARGSGVLTVLTAPLYTPAATYHVSGASQTGTTDVVADDTGRLSFLIDLGPSHQGQQQAFDDADVEDWAVASVSISPAPVARSQ